jgi:hypothetical protein
MSRTSLESYWRRSSRGAAITIVSLVPAPFERQPAKSATLSRALAFAKIDLSAQHRQPLVGRLVLATVASIAGCLAADAILVVIGEAIFPSTRGYVHFQFSDYGKLTVIGVIVACVAWPIVTRITSAPRWLFFRLAVLVTLFLWLPDIYILHQGQPGNAVAVLMVMHLAIALVTYNLLVRIAPPVRKAHNH